MPSESPKKEVKVIVIDDSAPVRRRMVSMLSKLSHVDVAGEAEDVAGTIETVRRLRPDAVVLDIQLPDGNGIEALKAIKREWPDTAVIMLTNHADPFYRRACTRAGALFFFDKSTEFERVAEVLGEMAA